MPDETLIVVLWADNGRYRSQMVRAWPESLQDAMHEEFMEQVEKAKRHWFDFVDDPESWTFWTTHARIPVMQIPKEEYDRA